MADDSAGISFLTDARFEPAISSTASRISDTDRIHTVRPNHVVNCTHTDSIEGNIIDCTSSNLPTCNTTHCTFTDHPKCNVRHCTSAENPEYNVRHCTSAENPEYNVRHCTSVENPEYNVRHCTSAENPECNVRHRTSADNPVDNVRYCTFAENPECNVRHCTSADNPVDNVRHCTSTDNSKCNFRYSTTSDNPVENVRHCTSTDNPKCNFRHCTTFDNPVDNVRHCTSAENPECDSRHCISADNPEDARHCNNHCCTAGPSMINGVVCRQQPFVCEGGSERQTGSDSEDCSDRISGGMEALTIRGQSAVPVQVGRGETGFSVETASLTASRGDTAASLADFRPDHAASPSLHTPSDSADMMPPGVEFINYIDERQMPEIVHLIQRDLSEPYSIYTYRYFINNWPNLCFLAVSGNVIIGAIVCKLDKLESFKRRATINRGYIAMLAVDKAYRQQRIGSLLVRKAIGAMSADGADEIVLETEVSNTGALRLYENLGFVRDKRLFRYYLNGGDAFRLKLWLWP